MSKLEKSHDDEIIDFAEALSECRREIAHDHQLLNTISYDQLDLIADEEVAIDLDIKLLESLFEKYRLWAKKGNEYLAALVQVEQERGFFFELGAKLYSGKKCDWSNEESEFFYLLNGKNINAIDVYHHRRTLTLRTGERAIARAMQVLREKNVVSAEVLRGALEELYIKIEQNRSLHEKNYPFVQAVLQSPILDLLKMTAYASEVWEILEDFALSVRADTIRKKIPSLRRELQQINRPSSN